MITIRVLLSIALVIILTGCVTSPQQQSTTPSPPQPEPTETVIDIKQPEPGTPIISGEISGLPDELRVTIRVRTQTGNEIQWGNRKGNVVWETVISNARESEFYTVLAEAEGYKSTPESYEIFIKEKVAYIVEEDTITKEEARHLDFQFEPQE